jgi:apyrase
MRWSRHLSIPFLPGHGTFYSESLYGTGGPPMQLVLAYVCVAMAIGVFVMGIVVFWLIIKRAFVGKYLEKFDAIGLWVAMILGGGLIWLGLHYGLEFLVNQPVQDKLAVAPQRDPKQSSACNTVEARYGLIIDAGSSGSRIYIYCWKPAGVNGIPWVTAAPALEGEPSWTKKVDKGLSEFPNAIDAKNSLEPLTNYALEKIGNDPETLKQTPLHLMATAGMRLLEDKDKDKADEIIRRVDRYLKETFARARTTVIRGKKEALYGWIAVNYLMGFLKEKDGNSSPTMGILELGGASTQIAYASSNAPAQNLATLQSGNTAYQIYVHSLRDSGQDQALKEINEPYTKGNASKAEEKKLNPCYPKGYEDTGLGMGDGKYDACKEKIIGILNKKTSLPLVIQPRNAFLAYSGYYYARSFFKLKPFLSLTDFENAGKEYCGAYWPDLLVKYSDKNDKYLPEYCFKATYIAALLQTGYGFQDTQQIIIADTLHGNEISWTLGAMIDMAGAKLTLEEE